MSRHVKRAIALTIFSLIIKTTLLWSYEDVKLEKIIPLVDRKASPTVLHLDSKNQLWILNGSLSALQQISVEGKALVNLMPGKKPDSIFKTPVDFGFLSNGSLVVADPGLSRISVIGPEIEGDAPAKNEWKKNKLLYSFPSKEPTALAVSHDDVIAVGYDNQSAVEIFSADGVLLHRLFPSDKYPLKKVVAMAYANNGNLWVLEEGMGVLHRFSADRKWLGAIEGMEGARSVALDEFGFAYVSMSAGRWKEITPEGSVTGTFGTKGKNPGEMLNPHGIAVSDASHVWVCESGNIRLQNFRVSNKDKKNKLVFAPAAYLQARLAAQWEDQAGAGVISAGGDILLLKSEKNTFEWMDQQGTVKSSWKKKGKGTAGLVNPNHVALDAAGKIWVSDEDDHTLKLISETGEVEKTLGQKGKKEGNLKSPTLFSFRQDDSVVVADKDNSRVQVLSPTGLFLFALGPSGKKEGQISFVTGLATNNDLIAVLDGQRKALLFYETTGKFVSEIANKEGKAPYWNEPTGIATDTDGRFYILDNGSHRVRIFNKKGQFLADFSSKGQRIACGSNHRVLILAEKEVLLYTINLVPKALQNIAVEDVEGVLQIKWDANSESQKYMIYRSSEDATFVPIAKVEVSTFSEINLKPGVFYTYAVAGLNDMGYEGNWSLTKPIKAPKRKDVSLISIEKTDFKPVFTAAHKYYVTNPVGEITIQNNDDKAYHNVKLALSLKSYSDYATEIIVPDLEAGEKKAVPVTITFNDKCLELTENTPVQVDIRLSYFEDNLEKSVTQNAPITLNSRNAIAWNDRARIASFITPRDTPIVEFSRTAIRNHMAILKGSTIGKPLAKAALFYESINALGVAYVPDPTTPFSEVSKNPEILDYVQFPRDTLRRKTGDCDDTTALLAALLESVGVQVALVDMPGHIFLMANLGESDASLIGLPEERFVRYSGTLWVPIETTQLGHNFLSAWQTAASEVKAAQEKKEIQFIPIDIAMEKYQPVTLVEVDKETPAFPEEKVAKTFPPLLAQLQEERYQGQLKEVRQRISDDPVNHMLQVQLAMVHVEGGQMEEGKKLFISLLKEDEPVDVQAAAHNNLGNLSYLTANYQEAAVHYEKAAALTPQDAGIAINRARIAWRLGDIGTSKKFLEEAQKVMPDWREYAGDIPAEYLPK